MNKLKQFEQQTQDLLNGGIDGELNRAEQAELNKLLENSEDIRHLNHELSELTELLDSTPEREPPQYLHNAIISSVRLPVAATQDEKQGIFATWLPAHWMRTGVALAAGVVLTAGIYEIGSKSITPEDAANMTGTMVQSRQMGQTELLDSVQIRNGVLDGTIELHNKGDFLVLDVKLNSDSPTRLEFDLDGFGLAFEDITRMPDRQDKVSIIDGSVNVVSDGEQHYALKLRKTAAQPEKTSTPLLVELFANDTLVYEAELSAVKR